MQLINRAQAKAMIGVSDSRLSLLARRGRIKRVRRGRQLMFSLASVEAYIASRPASDDHEVKHGYWVPTPEEIAEECRKIRAKTLVLGGLTK